MAEENLILMKCSANFNLAPDYPELSSYILNHRVLRFLVSIHKLRNTFRVLRL